MGGSAVTFESHLSIVELTEGIDSCHCQSCQNIEIFHSGKTKQNKNINGRQT